MLAGLPVPIYAVHELADLVRDAGADDLADRLEAALETDVKLLALTLDERALMLSALEDPPDDLAELRAVLLADHQWRRGRRDRLIQTAASPSPQKPGRRPLPTERGREPHPSGLLPGRRDRPCYIAHSRRSRN